MQEKNAARNSSGKKGVGKFRSTSAGRTKKPEDRLFAEDTEPAPDLSKRTGSSQLSGEAAARLFEANQDRARGRGKQRNIPAGEDKAARSVFGSRTKVSVVKIARRSKRGSG